MGISRNGSVLVTGGRGFVGRGVVKLLQQSRYNTLSLDQSETAGDTARREQLLQERTCDVTDALGLSRLLADHPVNAIIHLAAILPTAAQRDPLRATKVNVQGSLNLLELARSYSVQRFVFGSSLSVYGTWPADYAVSESDRAAPEDLYGAAKLYVERLGAAYREAHSIHFVSLRIGRVVGPGSQSPTSAWRSAIFERLGTNQPAEISMPYSGAERLLLVHVDDVAKMLVTLLEAPSLEHAVYNAPCESMTTADLQLAVESLNANIRFRLGEQKAAGNPRLLDSNRFLQEFRFQTVSISEQLRIAARKQV
jgi:nucleoside-diphosphate-sugar epimerase